MCNFNLDVDDIKFVINYDYPNNSEDYVHRIGRTGRRDKMVCLASFLFTNRFQGTAYTFFTPSNSAKARDLIKVLVEAKQQIPPQLNDMASRGGGGGNSRGRWGYPSAKRGPGGDDYGAPKRTK